ncbi:MAG: glycoside hydrolase family 36 protein [Bacillota bacterium]
MFVRSELLYLQDGRKTAVHLKDDLPAGISVEIDLMDHAPQQGQTVAFNLRNRDPLELLDYKIELSGLGLAGSSEMMVNGFQSWSRSEALAAGDRIATPAKMLYPACACYGDYRSYRYTGRHGRFHSWTYTYLSDPAGDTVWFIGSLDESAGYTLFDYDYYRDRLLIQKDCAGAVSQSGYPLLRLYFGRGKLEALLDRYFHLLGVPRRLPPRAGGWTSWYNYYTHISEAIILHNLNELARLELPLEYFQIDDGWQSALGDWLECSDRFPAGMQKLAAEIRRHGFQPGLWLAPFVCNRGSRIFQENPQWLLRNRRGKPVKAGYNPLWKGWFYALDFYAPGFQDYLRRIFATVKDKWGYSLLKLDFLYAAALLPRAGKSRGQVMTEVMEFIRAQTQGCKLLGCGVPLGPAFGKVDYCRIGSDVGPFWEFTLKGLHYRERVSTVNSLVSTIGRRHLDRRAFRNDPDVFLLRDGVPKVNQNRLTPDQRYTLFFLNNLLGGLIFFSDNVDSYTAAQLRRLRSSFPNLETVVKRVHRDGGFYRIEFTVKKNCYLALANLDGKAYELTLADGPYFHAERFVLQPGQRLRLEPYQTICLYKVEPREDKPYLLGSSGHIYPGAQLEKLIVRGRSVTLQLHKHASPETKVFLAVPRGMINLQVNKVNYPVTLKNRIHFIAVPFPEN